MMQTPERWQQAKEILHAALDRAPAERTAFLDEACAADAELRAEVVSLLRYEAEAEDFSLTAETQRSLDEPASSAPLLSPDAPTLFAGPAPPLRQQTINEVAGQRIGRYQLLRELGQGGMGTVYLAARADDFRQQVALKLVKPRLGLLPGTSADVLTRFRNERQILAALNHPNIARLLDGGATADGLPYLVMEYIEGQPLDTYCNEHQLSTGERLKLFRQVCSAVHYAHQHLVIHRDLKPSNILVTKDGTPKLLDFGIAKLLTPDLAAQTLHETAPEHRLLTPAYASPEQVRGELLTAASDVYSLGVLLYELLTGHSPYRRIDLPPHLLLRVVCEEEPERPSTSTELNETGGRKGRSALRGDLDNIVLQALHKEPARRYASVEQLSEDIRRHLARLPVSARRDTLLYRTSRFIRRNRAAALAASTAAVAVLLLAVAFFVVRERLRVVNSVAILPFTNSVTSDDYLAEGIANHLAGRLAQLPRLRVTPPGSLTQYRQRAVDPLSAGHDLEVEMVLSGSVQQTGEQLAISAKLTDVRWNRTIWSQQYEGKASEVLTLEDRLARDSAGRLRLKLSGQEEQMLTRRYTDNTEAYNLYLRGRHFWNKRTEESLTKSSEYFRQAIEKDPHYALAYAGLADAWSILGFIRRPAETLPNAKQYALKAVELDDLLAEARTSLARVTYIFDWHTQAAEREFLRAIELNPSYSTAHLWYSDLLVQHNRAAEASREVRTAQQLDPLSLITNSNYAIVLYFLRQYDQAIEQGRKTLDLDPNLLAGHNVMAWAALQQGRPNEAVEIHKKALASGGAAATLSSLGYAYALAGKRQEARALLERLLHQAEQRYVPPYFIARIYTGLGEQERALDWLERSEADRSPWTLSLAVEPQFEPLRSAARYRALVQRLGLTP
jgi:eukaryotic-like serine/threonine-protein kinase